MSEIEMKEDIRCSKIICSVYLRLLVVPVLVFVELESALGEMYVGRATGT